MKTSNKILTGTYLLGLMIAFGLLIAAKSNMTVPEMIPESGTITTIEKSISSFSTLKIGNDINVKIVPSASPSLSVESDAKFQEYLKVIEDDGYLNLEVSREVKFDNPHPFNITLGINQLQEINIHGDSSVKSDSTLTTNFITLRLYGASQMDLPVQIGQINLEINGASNASLRGTTDFLDANLSGATNLEAKELISNIVHVQASGASNADVQAIDFLKAHASGASNVRYVGTPKQLNDNYNGAASVRPID